MKENEIINLLSGADETINKIVLSDKIKGEYNKIIVRPVVIKDKKCYQLECFTSNKVFHKNVQENELFNDLPLTDFKQILVELVGKNLIFSATKSGYKLKEQENKVVTVTNNAHNKTKQYLINEGDDVPVMVELGIFTKENKIVRTMYDKFKQINRFIEIIDDVYKTQKLKEITILDFGCGKSYLTFLVYHYFVNIKKVKAKIIGYDIKKDVVEHCNNLAKKYNYTGLEFVLSDVSKDKLFDGKIDMVISLHACNTATDYALNFAIKNNVKNIFSVPCCQHEINLSIKPAGEYDILLKDGLFKERFSSLLTDSIRTQILRAMGYSVDVIEFVGFEHSPKNIMLRASKTKLPDMKLLKEIENLKNKYKFNQTLFDIIDK